MRNTRDGCSLDRCVSCSSVSCRIHLVPRLFGCRVPPTDRNDIYAAVDNGDRDVRPLSRYRQEWVKAFFPQHSGGGNAT